MSTSPSVVLPNLATTLAAHFDSTKSVVLPSPLNGRYKTLGFGRNLSDQELIEICGAPIGSKLSLSYVPASTSHEITPEGIFVEIENSTYFDYSMNLIFHVDKNGKRAVYIKLVMASQKSPVAATSGLILEKMLRANDAITTASDKFSEYSMLAAGGREWPDRTKSKQRWGGFAAWPRYGFDMPLEQKTVKLFPLFPYIPPLAGVGGGCSTVSSLLSLEKGQEFWDIAGDGWYMSFDTTPNSYSRTTLASYLSRKYS